MRDQTTSFQRCATLQQVLDALDEMFAAGEIGEAVLRDARSGILSFSRAVGKPPARLKADIVELLDRMDGNTATRAGFMPRTWSNTKSLLRRALNLAGNPTKAARRDRPLAPAWDLLLGGGSDKDVQTRLRPLAGYCSDRQIEPIEVDEAVLEAYAAEVRRIARSRNPADAVQKMRRCWNKLVDIYPTELSFRALVVDRRKRIATPIEAMPASFRAEMALLRKARSAETFEEIFRCKPLKHAKAVDNFCGIIMRIVTAMKANGHALSDITALRYLVQPQHFEATMRQLKVLTEVDDLRQLGSYVSALHWLGDVWVKLNDTKMRTLKRSMAVVGRRKAEIADSSLEVLEQLDDPIKREKIKKLAETVAAEFEAKGDAATTMDAEQFRNALFWELGLTTGWRPASRARINIHDDIVWAGRKIRATATLTAGKAAEKTELRRKVELPLITSRVLRLYIDRALPRLRSMSDPNNPYLFPGRRIGKHTTTNHLSMQSAKLIARRTSVVGATGQKSRHVSVKLHLIENPGDWQTAQEHLGHRHSDTTKQFYANVTQVESSKRVHRSMGKR
jgi:integrase